MRIDTVMRVMRLCAAVLVLLGIAGIARAFGQGPWYPGDEGTCSAHGSAACITRHGTYSDMYCSGGGGEDCITCQPSPTDLCTWHGGDMFGYYD
jgi:hypothetical protein